MSIPSTILAGDSLSLSIAAPDGRTVAAGWALTVTLVPFNGVGTAAAVSSSAADPAKADAFLLTVAASTTAVWVPAEYSWVAQVSNGAERVTFASGRTTVKPDPTSATTLDMRSVARKALDAIDAYLADANNLTAASYTIAGRSLSRFPRAELIAERSRWQAEVAREEAAARMAAGLSDRRRVHVRWGA